MFPVLLVVFLTNCGPSLVRCRCGGAGCGILAIGRVELRGAQDVEGGVGGHCSRLSWELGFRE